MSNHINIIFSARVSILTLFDTAGYLNIIDDANESGFYFNARDKIVMEKEGYAHLFPQTYADFVFAYSECDNVLNHLSSVANTGTYFTLYFDGKFGNLFLKSVIQTLRKNHKPSDFIIIPEDACTIFSIDDFCKTWGI